MGGKWKACGFKGNGGQAIGVVSMDSASRDDDYTRTNEYLIRSDHLKVDTAQFFYPNKSVCRLLYNTRLGIIIAIV